MKVNIEIQLSGAAIAEDRDGEVARILRGLADRIAEEDGLEAVNCTRLFDLNGNSVGDIHLCDEVDMKQEKGMDDDAADEAGDTWRRYALLLTAGQRQRLSSLELLAGREELLRVAQQWASNTARG